MYSVQQTPTFSNLSFLKLMICNNQYYNYWSCGHGACLLGKQSPPNGDTVYFLKAREKI